MAMKYKLSLTPSDVKLLLLAEPSRLAKLTRLPGPEASSGRDRPLSTQSSHSHQLKTELNYTDAESALMCCFAEDVPNHTIV
jgi:hypothetical protein